MRVIYHPLAESEVVEAARFYEGRRAGLGTAFLDEIDASVGSILRDPSRLPAVEADVRRSFVRRFPYGIYYRSLPDEVRILTVKHHRRDSSYWRSRR